jgi:hypothetical protein
VYCGLKRDGRVNCWGVGASSVSNVVQVVPPDLVRLALSDMFGAGEDTICGVDGAGRGVCWGNRNASWDGPLAAIAASRAGICALDVSGNVACNDIMLPSSSGRYRQIAISDDWMVGLDDSGTAAFPNVTFPDGLYTEITASIASRVAAVRSDGVVVSFSSGMINLSSSGGFVHAALDSVGRACALDAAGEVTCWPNWPGVSVAPLDRIPRGPFVQIVGSNATFCALRASGTTACWGDYSIDVPDGW